MANRTAIVLTGLGDVEESSAWGLIQPYYNTVESADEFVRPSAFANTALLTRWMDETQSVAEIFFTASGGGPSLTSGPGIYRATSSDQLRTWSTPVLVINGTADPTFHGGVPWFVNAQNMGYNALTGEYLSLIYGGKAFAYPQSKFTSHGALGFVLRSKNGLNWTCDGGFEIQYEGQSFPYCDLDRPTTIDHDDGSMTFDQFANQWVNVQIVIQNISTPTLPSGFELKDNSPGRRVVGFRTSNDDGHTWTCAPSYLNGGNPFCGNKFNESSPVVLPLQTDPPELQVYRARPFRYFDRWVMAVYNYAPSPLCRETVSSCHGPHMGTSWWILPPGKDLANHTAWADQSSRNPYAWQRLWRQSRVLGPHEILNHNPLVISNKLIWFTKGRWVAVPDLRVAGLYSPANAQWVSKPFDLILGQKGIALAIESDSQWQVPTSECDPLQELCQAYIMIEILAEKIDQHNASTWYVVPGFEMNKCIVKGLDTHRMVLKWRNATIEKSTADLPTDITRIKLRVTMRDAVVYAFTFETIT